ncbi:MAG: hypothetical protein OHK0021_20710 [Bryobacter sp.]
MTRRRSLAIVLVYLACASFLFLTHSRLISLPFFWDEAGQFISQSWDLYSKGLILPESALPNSHPPGLPLFLSALWRFFGFGIELTRGAMLLWGAAYLCAGFLLAVELVKGSRGAPAFLALGFLAAHPLVYTQSMMAQLDLPSAACVTAMLVAYLQRHERTMVLCALAAVAFKETSVVVPLVLAGALWRRGEPRLAILLGGLPVLLLLNWFGFLWWKTGFAFGDGEYSRYNLEYPLHPARLAFALFRRASFLLVENFHFVPALVLAWRWRAIGFQPVWQPLVAASLAFVLAVSASGGAVLERYLLPVLPVLAAAFAGALSTLAPRLRYGLFALTLAGMTGCLFVNMPWPYALENNLAMVDLVELQRNTVGLVESKFRERRVTTTWPLNDALEKPYLGYGTRKHEHLRETHQTSVEAVNSLDWVAGDVLILYSRAWQPDVELTQFPPVRWFLDRFFEMPQDLRREQMDLLPGFRRIVGYEQRGFWVEILVFTGDGI